MLIDLDKDYLFPDENNCPKCGHWDLKEYSIWGVDENSATCRKCFTRFGYVVNHDVIPLTFRYTYVEE